MQPVKHTSKWKETCAGILIVLTLISIFGCMFFRARIPMVRSKICRLISNEYGQVLHSTPSPHGSFTVLVRNVDCGQFLASGKLHKCSILIELKDSHQISDPFADPFRPGYEIPGACNANINWPDDTRFEVITENGEREEIYLSEWGVLP